ncbi:MAG: Zn-dependent hydrolase [Tissierellaceae bacterium]
MVLKRLQTTFRDINKFGSGKNGINRLAYTAEERGAIDYLKEKCIKEGMQIKIDSCGNLIARREGKNPKLPAIACGSHIDTVYEGGKYDGTVGVIAGLEVIRSLNDKNINTLHPIEFIVFACKKSSRFGLSSIGSKAMAGVLDIDSIQNLVDKDGITIGQAFERSGLDFSSIHRCKRTRDEIGAFVELHIEQGSYLEDNNFPIGVVTGIAASTRLKIDIEGVTSHSGATNMRNRRDALLGAAEIALMLEKFAKKESHKGTVGTVGMLNIKPGTVNAIPGYAEMQVDIRGIYRCSKDVVLDNLIEVIPEIEKKRGLKIDYEMISNDEPVLMNSRIQDIIRANCEMLGIKHTLMQSGAGHDAMSMAKICPTGMIFLPSKGGLSHNPNEYTSMANIVQGTMLLRKVILDLAKIA